MRRDCNGCYDREAAVDYADEWSHDTNDDFYYYLRGDCANFVSQCLYAGGIEMNNEWYSHRSRKTIWQLMCDSVLLLILNNNRRYNWDVGQPWRLANKQYHYFKNPENGYINGDVIEISSSNDIAHVAENGGVQPGDLLYFSSDGKNAYHATIITKVENGMIYYAGHSQSRYDQPLRDSMGSDSVFIIRINDDA